MTRILADLPDEDIKWLDQLAAERLAKPGCVGRVDDTIRRKRAER
jgi:hypothetical protein